MTAPDGRTVVLDSSALAALLVDAGELGEWVAAATADAAVAAPHLAVFETANILRRQQLRGEIDTTMATLSHQDLLALPLQLWPYPPLAERAWQLRDNVTVYDAAYVALAEFLDAAVLTLDGRLARATGLRCPVWLPPQTP